MGVDKSLLPSKAHLHTKNNNRVIMRTHTHYERSSSPWNRKVLIWLWSFQTIGSIIVTAFAAALLDRRDGLQQRWDDGLADALFLITSFPSSRSPSSTSSSQFPHTSTIRKTHFLLCG